MTGDTLEDRKNAEALRDEKGDIYGLRAASSNPISAAIEQIWQEYLGWLATEYALEAYIKATGRGRCCS